MKNSNKGFSIVEVSIASVVLCLVILGVTFGYQSVVKLNHVSGLRDRATLISNSIIEQLSTKSYNEIINCSDIRSIIDLNSSDCSVSKNNSNIYINNIDGLNISIKLDDSKYSSKNLEEYPKLMYLNKNDVYILNDLEKADELFNNANLGAIDIARNIYLDISVDGRVILVRSGVNYNGLNIINDEVRLTDLKSIYIMHNSTSFTSDTLDINNSLEKEFDIYLIGQSSEKTSANIDKPFNFQFNYSQDSTSNLVNLYTNYNNLNVVSAFLNKYDSLITNQESKVRMFDVSIDVYDLSGNLLLSRDEYGILGD